jgi:hypothetical protein
MSQMIKSNKKKFKKALKVFASMAKAKRLRHKTSSIETFLGNTNAVFDRVDAGSIETFKYNGKNFVIISEKHANAITYRMEK